MKKRLVRQRAADLAVALVMAAVAALLAFLWHSSGMKGVAPAISPFLVLRPTETREEAVADYAGVRRVYEFDLTGASGVRAGTLFVYLRHTAALAEKDGVVLADTGEAEGRHIGRTPGCYWLALPISPEDAGRTLRLTLTPVYRSVAGLEPDFLVMDRQMLLHLEVLPDEAAVLLLGCVTAAAGLFLTLLSLSLGLAARDRRRVFYLGAFSCAVSVWKLCALSSVPLLLDWYGRQKLLWYAGAAAYLLMPLLSLRLLTVLLDREDGRAAPLCCLGALAALVLLALQVFGVAELHDALLPYGVGMAALHLAALAGQRPNRAALLWLLPTAAALGLDLALFPGEARFPAAPVFLVWTALDLFLRGFGFLRAALRRERELREKDEALRGEKTRNLIAQIRPHFICNTLASVSMLCDSEPRRAAEIVANFNNYLQANFTALAATEPIPFAAELEHTRAYLNVQTALYASKLRVEYDTAFTDFRLPPLTLQPIVENSVKHGVGRTHRPERVLIRSRAADGGAEIVIEDDGAGYEPSPDGAAHIGLANVRERLALMCGGTLEIGPRPGGGTAARLFVPMETEL